MGKHKFIALEGLSGAGKSTIGEILAEKISGIFYKTPAQIFRDVRSEIDKCAEPTARFLFYLGGIFQSSFEISKLLDSCDVVCDRYLLTTLLWHKLIGVDIDKLIPLCDSCLVMPDYTFLILCENDIRLARLYGRGLSPNDRKERENNLEGKLLVEYKGYHLLEIDNSQEGAEIAVEAILKILQG